MVESSTVNRVVAGSSPAIPATNASIAQLVRRHLT